jgi:hypothetical protein
MASVIQNENGQFEIQLTIEWEFIKRYKLGTYTGNPLPASKPFDIYISASKDGKFTYPFYFPPYEKTDYPKEFLESFLDEFRKVLPYMRHREGRHLDHLLFLAYIFPNVHSKEQLTTRSKILKRRGRLLVELLDVPWAKVTRERIYDIVDGNEELNAHLEEAIKGKKEYKGKTYYQHGKIDTTLIDEELWQLIIKRVERTVNISIALTMDKQITISKDVPLRIDGVGAIRKFDESLQQDILRNLLTMLVDEQRKAKTELYNVLCSDGFNQDQTLEYSKLLFQLGNYENRGGYNKWVHKQTKLLSEYLHNEGIACFNETGSMSGEQLQIIHHYLLILGLLQTKGIELKPYADIAELQAELTRHSNEILVNHTYGVEHLRNIFKKKKTNLDAV